LPDSLLGPPESSWKLVVPVNLYQFWRQVAETNDASLIDDKSRLAVPALKDRHRTGAGTTVDEGPITLLQREGLELEWCNECAKSSIGSGRAHPDRRPKHIAQKR
jgi:hypothetical protein